ncbi:MAG: flavodoxin family protein [Actinomycetia bacterium]|nr:flavodoxin family protein [Actinomycetes bacterium]
MVSGTRKTNNKYKIVAIYGSPRIGGNTAVLMDYFLKGIMENTRYNEGAVTIDSLLIKDKNISPCRECCNCSKTGECIIPDDMQEIYKLLIEADFIAVASPVFFTTVSGYLKAVIDRCQRFWVLKYEHNKKIIKKNRGGIFISTSGSGSKDIFKCSIKVIRSFFDVLFVDYLKDFTFNSMEKKGDILNNEKAISALFEFGKNMDFNNGEGK